MSRVGIYTGTAGYVKLSLPGKTAVDGTTLTNAEGASTATLIYYFNAGDLRTSFPPKSAVYHTGQAKWYNITASDYGEYGGGGGDDMRVTVYIGPGVDWDGENITAYNSIFNTLTESGDLAMCCWYCPDNLTAGYGPLYNNTVGGGGAGISMYRNSSATDYVAKCAGVSEFNVTHTSNVNGTVQSHVVVFDGTNGWSWINKVNEQSDAYATLYAGDPDTMTLGNLAYAATTYAQVTLADFCILDLTSAGTVDTALRQGIRDAFHDAAMDTEAFCTGLRSLLAAGESIVIYYWKLNELGWGRASSTANTIHRYSRTVTDVSIGTESDDATDGDPTNCTGICLGNSADQFQSGGYYLWPSQTISFGDHADFSFAGGGDVPFSYTIWTDANINPIALQQLCYKQTEYNFVIQTDGTLKIVLFDAQTDQIYTISDAVQADGNLHLFGFTYDGGGVNTGLNLYIDGAVVASTDGTAGDAYGAMADTADLLQIAVLRGNFYGASMIKGELSASQMLSIYNQGPYV
ncbi:MAG: hypothetical protein ABIG61_17800 [Planctomycetota bacterium]